MTQVDFHVNAAGKLAYACRLGRKGYGAGSRMVFHSADPAILAELDRELWTFSTLDFIPHVRATHPLAPETPVVLAGSDDADACPHHDVLVNLDHDPCAWFSRFERLIEVVGADEDDLEAGRARYRFYKDRGYPLTRYDLARTAADAR